jgi:hypothetical protein
MKLILSGTVETISTRQDGTVKFTYGTQELDSRMAGDLFQLRNKYVKCFLSDSNITEMEAGLIDQTPIKNGKKVKTPSQRLRAVIFKVHEDQCISAPFEDFYNNEIERIIDQYKSTLND